MFCQLHAFHRATNQTIKLMVSLHNASKSITGSLASCFTQCIIHPLQLSQQFIYICTCRYMYLSVKELEFIVSLEYLPLKPWHGYNHRKVLET